MRRIGKTRKGFTLVEMVLVIAIIVILAGVLVVGIGTYLNKARAASSSITERNSSIEVVASIIDLHLDG
ncbi:type IV pilus assembly protein PilA [Ruminococcaceae bacterium R-25]|nr:type IV pilus assembly protein PilA [Ruminococcaceae bacterium R-25]SUQ22035.1 prepilin-type N-terminal cleavage/methylation domain-containing protein [Oscillospiraceae bacterium]